MASSRGVGIRRLRRCVWPLALVGLALVFGSVLPVAGARSASMGEGLIAFTRADGIFVMRPDGSGVHPLRRGGVAANAHGLAWSPDGSKLAFDTSGQAVWAMDADGSHLVRLVARAASPTWSPAGRKIAFIAGQDIWVMNADGSNRRRLVRTSGIRDPFPPMLRHPVAVGWSPAGGRLVVMTFWAYIANVYVMNNDGSFVRCVSRHFDVLGPAWAPDGRRIAFERWTSGNGTDDDGIYVMKADGTRRVRLTSVADGDVRHSDPTWSPDGSTIAFVRSTGDFGTEIYVVNADGTGLTRLTRNRLGAGSPAWQPVP